MNRFSIWVWGGGGEGGEGGWQREREIERPGGVGWGRDRGKIGHGGLQSAVVLCDYTLL